MNNLKHTDFTIPLGTLTCVTGVSGSGKTTLVLETLIPALKAQQLASVCQDTCVGSMPKALPVPT